MTGSHALIIVYEQVNTYSNAIMNQEDSSATQRQHQSEMFHINRIGHTLILSHATPPKSVMNAHWLLLASFVCTQSDMVSASYGQV